MPIKVACRCGRMLNLKDAMAGKRGKCPHCGTALVVPPAGEPGAEGRLFALPGEGEAAAAAESRLKKIYLHFLEAEKKASREGGEDLLRKIRVSAGRNPFSPGAAVLLGAGMIDVLDPEQAALKLVASEFSLSMEEVREIVAEGRNRKWS